MVRWIVGVVCGLSVAACIEDQHGMRQDATSVSEVASETRSDTTSSPDVAPDVASGTCHCELCMNMFACRGAAAGCADNELCTSNGSADGGQRCVPRCDFDGPPCGAGTTCGTVMDCDYPVEVCR